MAAFITLQQAEEAFEHLIVTDDFRDLVNRAAQRLYRQGASPGWEYELDIPAIDANGEFVLDIVEISHVLAFKANGTNYYITPLLTTYKTDNSGQDRFVDLGIRNNQSRAYRLPHELLRKDADYSDYEVKALVRPAYKPVVNSDDTFPLQNIEPLKLAAMAIQYEDESDLERANAYMTYALNERESDSYELRGPHVTTIGVYDPASDEVTETIN
ncbi:MAG: hypothetical protein ACPH5P_00325 [Akkermansiaceae bacterium]